MSMSDRELLELAAKAAGLAWEWNACAGGIQHIPRGMRHYADWNPLADDGDALRLAAKLRLSVCFSGIDEEEIYAWAHNGGKIEIEDDCYRRAIVRAAAEIGRAI